MDHDSTWPDKNIRSTCTLDHGLFPIIVIIQATKTYRHQLVYQSPWPKCQLKDMYIKMMKKTVKSLNTIDSKSFELHDIISFNKPTTLEYPIRITRITYRL